MDILWGTNSKSVPTDIENKKIKTDANEATKDDNYEDDDFHNNSIETEPIDIKHDSYEDVKYDTNNYDNSQHLQIKSNKRKIIDNDDNRIVSNTPQKPKSIKRINIITSTPSTSSSSQDQKLNSVDSFFQSMAETVKTFPPHLIAKAKMKVCNIIGELELNALKLKGADPLIGYHNEDNNVEYLEDHESE